MAFYPSGFCGDGYYWSQETIDYGGVPCQDIVSFSDSYEACDFHESNFVDPVDCADAYDYSSYDGRYEINYSSYNFVEPKSLVHVSVPCHTSYVSYHTLASVSYSTTNSGFDEVMMFEDYDPTPYGGGYDIVSTYGKPLPPSNETCYPQSTPKPIGPGLGPEPIHEPEPQPKSMDSKPDPMPEFEHVLAPMPKPELLGLGEGEEEGGREGYTYPNHGYDYSWPEYDHGYDIGRGVGHDYGYGKQVVKVAPCEYDPHVVDFCENIFGEWPCLAKIKRQQMGIANNLGIANCHGNRHHDPWEGYANYIFGGPIVSCNPHGD